MDAMLNRLMFLILAQAVLNMAASTESIPNFVLYRLENNSFALVSFVECEVAISSTADDVTFLHYQSKSSYNEFVPLNVDTVEGFDSLNSSIPTVLVAHGFLSSPRAPIGDLIRGAFRSLYTTQNLAYNLIFIDWEKLASPACLNTDILTICYRTTKNTNVPRVGQATAWLLNTLIKLNKATWDKVVYVGHSLGSHIPNFMKPTLENGTLHHLHALDPAGVFYASDPDDKKLDPSDADFVSVIHTDITYYGTVEPRGHLDFYPNGGGISWWHRQPGCWPIPLETCSHSRAFEYFADSITDSSAFKANKCSSWNEYTAGKCGDAAENHMGWYSENPGVTGDGNTKHYLKTGKPKSSSQCAVWNFLEAPTILTTTFLAIINNLIHTK